MFKKSTLHPPSAVQLEKKLRNQSLQRNGDKYNSRDFNFCSLGVATITVSTTWCSGGGDKCLVWESLLKVKTISVWCRFPGSDGHLYCNPLKGSLLGGHVVLTRVVWLIEPEDCVGLEQVWRDFDFDVELFF